MRARRAATAAAAVAWALLCLRWFDDAAWLRPAWMERVPPVALAAMTAALAWPFVRGFVSALRMPKGGGGVRGGALLVTLLAVAFRLPLAWHGAAAYLTADGALSGIVALRARDGVDHFVFVPQVAYSGSLKSHLTAALAAFFDPARAFALVSVLFYAAFVAAVYRLALLAYGGADRTRVALGAGLYLAFAPPFLTRYSLSNDGNYVEVLALGAWGLVAAVRWSSASRSRVLLAGGIGLLLGLALWCHLLALIPAVTVMIALLARDARAALRSAPALVAGAAAGYLPGLLWNAAHGWASLGYVWPAETASSEPQAKAGSMLLEQWLVLAGYDPGYGGAADIALRTFAWCALVVLAASVVAAAASWRRATPGSQALLLLIAVNLAFAVLVLPTVPGNPRYLIFTMIAVPVLLARLLGRGRARAALAALIAAGAIASLAQAPAAFESDRRWREFVAELQGAGVRHCFTDFYVAAKIDFLSQEQVVCSSKLGPTTTEYFFDYREQTERAADAALIAVNPTAADKLERRLERLGVTYERRDLMRPVLMRLSRKVDPSELFPDRSFPLR